LDDHLTPAELERLAWGQISSERIRSLIAHLLHGCEPCRAALVPQLEALFRRGAEPGVTLSPELDTAYDLAIDRAFAAASRREAALEKVASLSGREAALAWLDEAGLQALPDAPPHIDGFSLIEAILEKSWVLRYENPAEMMRLAATASTMAERLSTDRYAVGRIEDLRFRALTELGNACRVADELDKAEGILGYAASLLQGTVDEISIARYFVVIASLYGSRRKFELARAAFDIASASYRSLGDDHLAGRALINKGIYSGYAGEPEEAIRLIREGLSFVQEDRDPDLLFLALHNQVRLLIDCGQYHEARIALWDLRQRKLRSGGRVNEVKVRWLEGQIYAASGKLDHAEWILLQVRDAFAESNLRYKAALAGLELGAVRLRQGRYDASEEVVLEAADVFMALGIRREAMMAVALLRKAFERRVATVALIEYVTDFLRRAEHDPAAQFLPPPSRA
jgi:tetratricopeptide (TPR) repeat protein